MRRLLPDSLAGWALLIVIAALTVAELTTLGAIAESHSDSTRVKGLFQLSERIFSASRAITAAAAPDRPALAAALGDATLLVRVDPIPMAAATDDETLSEFGRVLQERLARFGITAIAVAREDAGDALAQGSLAPPGEVSRLFDQFSAIYQQYAAGEAYVVSAEMADGTWMNFVNTIAAPPSLWSVETVAYGLGGIILVLAASTWALRQLTGPYGLLADAAERFSVDLDAGELPERGPREVRSAAGAFNRMRARLKRMIADRDQLVAAVSHDLRTPVTRLRLRAEFVEDLEQRRRMLIDLADIETMTQSVLAFASDAARPEQRQLLDLVSLLQSVCSDLPDVTFATAAGVPPRVALSAQPVALRRCVTNLVENAVKYGKRATVTLGVGDGLARVAIDDEGPGISAAKLDEVFRPFVRLEGSRNRDTGGTGLGLTIARSVARSHGGDVTLANRAQGGLRAELTLPLAPAYTATRGRTRPEPARESVAPVIPADAAE